MRLSDRIATGVGVLDLDFRASAAGVAGVTKPWRVSGYGDAGRLGPEATSARSARDAGGERFSYKGEPDREPA